jgi:ParB/RepB/Spo0J family partition protein
MTVKAEGIVGRTELAKVDPRAIIVDESMNYRKEYGDITSLKNSIIENGLLVPIRCQKTDDNKLKLVEGYRRMRAIKTAISENKNAFKWVPCIIIPKNTNEAEILLTNLAANDGLKPTSLEECDAYQRLINFGWHKKDIAKRVGRSVTQSCKNCRRIKRIN